MLITSEQMKDRLEKITALVLEILKDKDCVIGRSLDRLSGSRLLIELPNNDDIRIEVAPNNPSRACDTRGYHHLGSVRVSIMNCGDSRYRSEYGKHKVYFNLQEDPAKDKETAKKLAAWALKFDGYEATYNEARGKAKKANDLLEISRQAFHKEALKIDGLKLAHQRVIEIALEGSEPLTIEHKGEEVRIAFEVKLEDMNRAIGALRSASVIKFAH